MRNGAKWGVVLVHLTLDGESTACVLPCARVSRTEEMRLFRTRGGSRCRSCEVVLHMFDLIEASFQVATAFAPEEDGTWGKVRARALHRLREALLALDAGVRERYGRR